MDFVKTYRINSANHPTEDIYMTNAYVAVYPQDYSAMGYTRVKRIRNA